MGGAVKAVTRPITDVVASVTGGKTSGQKQAEAQTQAAQAQVAQMQETAKPASRSGVDTATSLQEQSAARSRLRRRGGRSLLSEARLNAESGVQTLGGGNSLGQ